MAQRKSILILVVVLSCASICFGKYSGGTGETNDPYRIAAAEDMNAIGANPDDWDAHFVMVNNINLADYTGTQFNIIGDDSNPFTGVFDGAGHTVSNLTYTTVDTDYIGLFGYVDDPNTEIKNLILMDPNVNAAGESAYVGCIIGWLNNGAITNCCVKGGGISGDNFVGGLVGWNWHGKISSCYTDKIFVNGTDSIGGLLGHNRFGILLNCYAKGKIAADDIVGGLVGHNGHEGKILNCYAIVGVLADDYIGGLVGKNFKGTISNCYAAGSIQGDRYIGGLVGYNRNGTVTASFWDITTSGQATSDGGEGKTTAEMKTNETFTNAGWDLIKVWSIIEGQTYPSLRQIPTGGL